MIINNVVDGGPTLRVPAHLSFGQHLIDCLKIHYEDDNNIAMVSYVEQYLTIHTFTIAYRYVFNPPMLSNYRVKVSLITIVIIGN